MEGGGIMLCPLKFSRYEFEGGETCIGAECRFFGSVCGSVDAHSKAQSKTEPKLSERPELLSDSREKLRIVMPRHNGEKYAKLMVKQFDQLINDELHDSREKLEADVRKFSQVYYANHLLVYDKVIELLDRQAAITERECLVQSVQGADAILTAENAELQVKADELQAAYDELTAIAAQLCRACGFSMVDSAGEVIS